MMREDAILNRLCDARAAGPFVRVELDDLDVLAADLSAVIDGAELLRRELKRAERLHRRAQRAEGALLRILYLIAEADPDERADLFNAFTGPLVEEFERARNALYVRRSRQRSRGKSK